MANALRRFVMGALVIGALTAAGTSPAAASTHDSHVQAKAAKHIHLNKKQRKLCRQAAVLRRAVIKKYTKMYGEKRGRRMPGRNVCVQGMRDGSTPSIRELEHHKGVLDRMEHPPPPPVATPVAASPASAVAPTSSPTSTTATASSASVSAPSGTLSAIAQCESGGNPSAIGGGGKYRGKYQFTYSTWASVGGSGDPAAASEAEQDYRASILYSRSGASPWPVCGR